MKTKAHAKERGILFTAPMAHALWLGRKTQTRRLKIGAIGVGTKLWVREPLYLSGDGSTRYTADNSMVRFNGKPVPWSWRTRFLASMHMPRSACRMTLTVTDVRTDNLQDISDDDALAEGIYEEQVIIDVVCYGGYPIEKMGDRFFYDGYENEGFEDPISAYADLFDKINGSGTWNINPTVKVLTFTVDRKE